MPSLHIPCAIWSLGGVPLLSGLKLTSKAMTNVFLQSKLAQAVLVSEGLSIAGDESGRFSLRDERYDGYQ